MSNDTSYNGWEGNGTRESAWATWNLVLWIDNEEHLYRMRRRRVMLSASDVEEFCREVFPDGTPDMDGVSDMGDVNWDEILGHWDAEDE